jgi:hypothetical protein
MAIISVIDFCFGKDVFTQQFFFVRDFFIRIMATFLNCSARSNIIDRSIRWQVGLETDIGGGKENQDECFVWYLELEFSDPATTFVR